MIERRITKVALRLALALAAVSVFCLASPAQSLGTAGTVTGTVTDPNGAVVPGASVKIENPVTHFSRTATTDAQGSFRFDGVPQQEYQLSVTASGFNPAQQVVSVRTSVPIEVKVGLAIAGLTSNEVTVTDTLNMVENVPTTHTDVSDAIISKLPVASPGSGLSDVVSQSSPAVVAGENGFFHASTSHGVMYSRFDEYWTKRINGFRRVPLTQGPALVASSGR
jgi:hypothetical protein